MSQDQNPNQPPRKPKITSHSQMTPQQQSKLRRYREARDRLRKAEHDLANNPNDVKARLDEEQWSDLEDRYRSELIDDGVDPKLLDDDLPPPLNDDPQPPDPQKPS